VSYYRETSLRTLRNTNSLLQPPLPINSLEEFNKIISRIFWTLTAGTGSLTIRQALGAWQYGRHWQPDNTAGTGSLTIRQALAAWQYGRHWQSDNTAGTGSLTIRQTLAAWQYGRHWQPDNTHTTSLIQPVLIVHKHRLTQLLFLLITGQTEVRFCTSRWFRTFLLL